MQSLKAPPRSLHVCPDVFYVEKYVSNVNLRAAELDLENHTSETPSDNFWFLLHLLCEASLLIM